MIDPEKINLRIDSRWRDFTEAERDTIIALRETKGLKAVVTFCKSIGKPWSAGRISSFFTARTREIRAEADQVRLETARAVALVEAARENGMDIDEPGAVELARKLGDVMKLRDLDPKTPEGRQLLLEIAPSIISLRAINQRKSESEGRMAVKKGELSLAERRVIVLEKKVNDAKQVVEQSKLTAEEQRARLKEILK